MKRCRWLVLGVLIGLVSMHGAASAYNSVHVVPDGVCTPILTTSLSPTGGTFNPGEVVHYTITLALPAVPGACSLDEVDVWFFLPRHDDLDPCDFPPDAVQIANDLSLNPGDSFSWSGADNPALDYTVPASDAGFVIYAGAAFPFHVVASSPPLRDCDEKTVQNFINPFGACCYPDGHCAVLLEDECAATGGVWMGGGTSCDPNPCPQPPGACCYPDGSCLVLTEAECAASGGVWMGKGTSCDPNPCPQPPGACCYPNGSCVVLTEAECAASGGVWMGKGTSCDPNPCPQPPGACCYPNGSCVVLTEAECAASGGVWMGKGTSCDPNPCAQPPGACCYPDGSCAVLTEAECAASGGVWMGKGTSCDPNPCPQPPGACCYPDGSCLVVTQAECKAAGGEWQGAGTSCDPNPCGGDEGCTPGFWKNHPDCWCDAYNPEDLVGSVFVIPSELSALADDTLLEALAYHGGAGVIGKARNLLRHGVAALLNGCNDDVSFPSSAAGVIDMVNDALATLDETEITRVQGILAGWNELGCPIDAHCRVEEHGDSQQGGAVGADAAPPAAQGEPAATEKRTWGSVKHIYR